MEKIDFVILWVDGNDPKWRQERDKHLKWEYTDGNKVNRFRDWDLLRYWFRGVEQYAPWVNRIFFVTWGHHPDWLNIEHPKLKVIKHTEYIPEEFLPTFNSNVIELNLHRIPELCEQFVLFNDDMFLIAPVKEHDFFKNELPCESALLGQIAPLMPEDIFPHTMVNNMAIINKHFSKQEVMCTNWNKFFSLCYGKENLRNLLLSAGRYFSCFRDLHIASSHLKSTFVRVWEREPEQLHRSCCNQFRTKDDISHWVIKWWRLCEGCFMPRRCSWGKCIELSGDDVAEKEIRLQRYRMLCLNDTDIYVDFKKTQMSLKSAFESILPKKSSFEK